MTRRGIWGGILAGLLLGAAVGFVLLGLRFGMPWSPAVTGGGQEAVQPDAGGDTTAAPAAGHEVAAAVDTDLNGGRTNAIVRATHKAAPAVVSINVVQRQSVRDPTMEFWERLGIVPRREYYRDVQNMGSGVIVAADGLIVTNHHVIDGAVQIIVTLSDGRQFAAAMVDDIERYDLAVLRIEAPDLPVAALVSDADLQIGEWAIAIGSPFGYLLADTQPTVTVGVISALNRDIKRAEGERVYLGMIQTDAAINPGNSGGPLVNSAGEVVGINTFILSSSGGSVGIGFAVPSSRVMTVIDEVRRYGHYREANLGLSLERLSPSSMRYLSLTDPVGAIVVQIVPGSPAWKAGLRAGDVLREIGGLRLDNLDTIYRLFYDANVGDHLAFRAERDHKMFDGEIVLEEGSR